MRRQYSTAMDCPWRPFRLISVCRVDVVARPRHHCPSAEKAEVRLLGLLLTFQFYCCLFFYWNHDSFGQEEEEEQE